MSTGTPANTPGSSPRATAASTSAARRRAAPGIDAGNGVELGSGDGGERRLDRVDGAHLAATDGVGEGAGVIEPGLHGWTFTNRAIEFEEGC
jgi:hypothetical protein